jgi:hypothetical protein
MLTQNLLLHQPPIIESGAKLYMNLGCWWDHHNTMNNEEEEEEEEGSE